MPSSTLTPAKQIGFVLSHEQCPVPQLVELGVAAEQAGFDLISVSDHFQPWQANQGHAGFAWVTLAALGQRTSRLRMGTMVTCPTLRYAPAVVAQAFATLGQLYPGRIYLGLGSGEALNEQAATGLWPAWRERSARLTEATEVIRQLWSGQPVSHRGTYYEVQARLYDVPSVPVPIYMAGNGPHAGRCADGLITDPQTLADSATHFEQAATAAGKDPQQMPVLMEHFVVLGDQREAEAAANLWRFYPKAWEGYFEMRDPEAIQQRAMAEVPLEQVLERWAVGTAPEVHIEALSHVFEAGASVVLVHCAQDQQRQAIDFYGEHVLPRVRQRFEAVSVASHLPRRRAVR